MILYLKSTLYFLASRIIVQGTWNDFKTCPPKNTLSEVNQSLKGSLFYRNAWYRTWSQRHFQNGIGGGRKARYIACTHRTMDSLRRRWIPFHSRQKGVREKWSYNQVGSKSQAAPYCKCNVLTIYLYYWFFLGFGHPMRAIWKLCASEFDHPRRESFQCKPVATSKSPANGLKYAQIWWYPTLTPKPGDKFLVKMLQCVFRFQNAGYINLEQRKLTYLWASLLLETFL